MADSNSNSSGSNGEQSGHSHRKTSRGSKAPTKDLQPLNSWITKNKPDKDGRGHRNNIYDLMECDVDRETATRAVAIVVSAASKRGYVPLCTEFASLLRDKKRLEMELNRTELSLLAQKRKNSMKVSQQCTCSCSSESGSGGSGSSHTRGTQTKPIPLLESSTSSVQSFSSSSTPCADACVSTDEFSDIDGQGLNQTDSFAANEQLKKAKEQISKLENQLYSLKAENQALKTQLRHFQKSTSKLSHLGLIENQSHCKAVKSIKPDKNTKTLESISPQGSPTLKGTLKKEKTQSFSTNLIKDQIPNIDQSCNLKSCVKHRIKNGIGHSTPIKVHPIPSIETKAFLCAENKPSNAGNTLVPLQKNKYQISDKKPLEQMPKVLPKVGDVVIVHGEMKGFVKYVGQVKGENSDFVGIHLHSPVGNNNGTLDGIKYFTCPLNYGAFVSVQDITQVIPKSCDAKEILSVDNMPFHPKHELNRSNCFERSANQSPFSQDKEERQSIEIAA